MTDEQFRKIYKQTRVVWWFIFVFVVVGALIENKLIVLVGTFMLMVLSAVHIIVKHQKE